jgi:hypothetical protein
MNNAERSARANVHPIALRDMQTACDDATMAGILRDNRAPYGPCSAIPSAPSAPPPPLRPSNVEPRPLQPPPGVALLDQQFAFLDAKEKAAEREAAAFQRFMEQCDKWNEWFAEFRKHLR